MQIDKQQIINMISTLGEPGNQEQSGQADRELPHQIDINNLEHQQLLQKFGINPQDLISRFTGGSGIPGL